MINVVDSRKVSLFSLLYVSNLGAPVTLCVVFLVPTNPHGLFHIPQCIKCEKRARKRIKMDIVYGVCVCGWWSVCACLALPPSLPA